MTVPPGGAVPRPTPGPIDEFVPGFLAGDQGETMSLVDALSPKLRAALARRFGTSAIAHRLDDILQDGWMRIFRRRHTFDPSLGRFEGWAYRIVINCANNALVRVGREPGTLTFDVADVAGEPDRDPGGGYAEGDEQEDESGGEDAGGMPPRAPSGGRAAARSLALRDVLMGLASDDRRMLAFFSCYEGDDWQRAFADAEDINRGTLRSRFSRALKKVRQEMAARGWTIDPEDLTHAPAGRDVRTRLEADGANLWVDETYRLAVSLVQPAGADRWPTGTELIISVSGGDVAAEPASQAIVMPDGGDAGPVRFNITPLRGGRFAVVLKVFSRHGYELLKEVDAALPPVKYRLGLHQP